MTLLGYTWTAIFSFVCLFWSLCFGAFFDHEFLDVVAIVSASYLGFIVCPLYRAYKYETKQ